MLESSDHEAYNIITIMTVHVNFLAATRVFIYIYMSSNMSKMYSYVAKCTTQFYNVVYQMKHRL